MGKFTSGPWFTVLMPWDNSGCIVATREDPHGAKIICDTGEAVWHDHTQEDIEEWKANARLIAAAPELLIACEAALAVFDAIYPADIFTGESGDTGPVLIASARNLLVKTIAKARGQAE